MGHYHYKEHTGIKKIESGGVNPETLVSVIFPLYSSNCSVLTLAKSCSCLFLNLKKFHTVHFAPDLADIVSSVFSGTQEVTLTYVWDTNSMVDPYS